MLAGGRLRLQKPLYVDEPHYMILDRSADEGQQADPFWVARGRRQHGMQVPLRAVGLRPGREHFRAAGRPKAQQGLLQWPEEPFWAAEGERNGLRFLDDLPSKPSLTNKLCSAASGRRSSDEDPRTKPTFLELLSAEEPLWAAREKRSAGSEVEDSQDTRESIVERSANAHVRTAFEKKSALNGVQESRNKCCILESISAERPLWAARRRQNGKMEEKRDRRSSLPDSLSAEEPFWAARGSRGLLQSSATEDPFWAARGKKDSALVRSPSPEELLSQVSPYTRARN